MTFRNRISDLLFCFVIGTLYSYALARAAMAATVVPYSTVLLLWLCAVMILVFYIIFFNRITALVTLGLLLLSGGITLLILWRGGFQAEWWRYLTALLNDLFRFAQDLVPYRQRYTFPILLGVAFATALVTAINLQVRFNFYALTLIALGVFGVPVYLEYGTSRVALYLFVICFVVLLAKKLNLNAMVPPREPGRRRRRRTYNPVFSLSVIPLGLLLVGAAYLMPKPHVATDSRALIQAADNFVFDISARKTMFFSGEDEDMGGEIVMDESFVMDVYADERLYLGGIIRDTYTGSAWTLSEEVWQPLDARDQAGWYWYPMEDYTPEEEAAQLYYMNSLGRAIRSVTMSLGSVRSKTVFSPPFRTNLWLSDDAPLSRGSLGELNVSRPLNRYSNYVQEYISWDYTDPYTAYLLQALSRDGEMEEMGSEMNRYLRLPDTLPNRVGELALELTADLDNNYERLKILEQYLASFPYTLNPDKPPQGADFVDHFLFEGQEGYCVYYASALAVMGRTVGIPTRYVEGFIMPEQRGANGAYTVTNAHAHAWAEAWFPGFGWVPFEATAPNYDLLYGDEWTEEEAPMLQTQVDEEQVPQQETGEPEDGMDIQVGEAAPVENAGRLGALTGLSILLVLLLSGAVRVLLYRLRLRRMEALPNREAVVSCFGRVLRCSSALGYPHSDYETALDFAARVGEEPVFQRRKLDLAGLAGVFSRASYSNLDISDEERAMAFRCYRELLVELKWKKYGRLRFFINRYLMGKF